MSPTSVDNKSISIYTDYAQLQKGGYTSPERLKLLKSTLRSNTAASENNVNKFLNHSFGKKKALVNNLTQTMNESLTDSSVYDTRAKKRIDENTTSATPMRAVPSRKYHTEKKTIDKRYTRAKNHTFDKETSGSEDIKQAGLENKNTVKIKIRNKKSNTTTSRVMQMLSSDPVPEDEGKYIATKDLTPLVNPDKQFKLVFKDLISSDWQKQFDTCNTLRALAVHHKDLLTNDSYILQNFIQGLIKQVESLRSTVSKNALLGVKDLIESLKKNLDNEIDYLLPAVMKKATDTNVFLSKAADDVLTAI
jgi:hypothetical protein